MLMLMAGSSKRRMGFFVEHYAKFQHFPSYHRIYEAWHLWKMESVVRYGQS